MTCHLWRSVESSRDKTLHYGNYDTMVIYDYLYSTATASTAQVWFADVSLSQYKKVI
jgi:hypothetical protein